MRFSLSLLAFSLSAVLTSACSSHSKTSAEANMTPAPTAPGPAKVAEKAVAEVTNAVEAAAHAECSTKGDTRILELRPKGIGCELAYTKNGQEGIVASSANGKAHCETTMNKIRERLKGSGFDCK